VAMFIPVDTVSGMLARVANKGAGNDTCGCSDGGALPAVAYYATNNRARGCPDCGASFRLRAGGEDTEYSNRNYELSHAFVLFA
jgi:hypothetical protein